MIGLCLARMDACRDHNCPLLTVILHEVQQPLIKALELLVHFCQLIARLLIELVDFRLNDFLQQVLTIATQLFAILHELEN